MPRRPSYLYLVPHVLKALWGRPATVSFPYGPLRLPDAYRGQITLDLDSCRGCGLCARDCPAGALEVELLGEDLRIVHYFDRCVSCGQCELNCRHEAVHLQPSFKTGAPSRSALQVVWVKRDSS